MTDAITIVLPWPDKRLSPNARAHRTVVARARKRAKADAAWCAIEAGARNLGWSGLTAAFTFHPPIKRHHDDDNLIGRCKAARDGVAGAIGLDDRHWRMDRPVIADPLPPHGKVVLTLTRAGE